MLLSKKIAGLFSCYADGENVTVDAPAAPAAESAPVAEPSAPTEDNAQYWGSKELNPDQRPLKIDTSILSREEIDEIIQSADPDIYMNDEEAKAFRDKQSSKQPQKKESSDGGKETDEEGTGKSDKGDSKEKAGGEEVDPDINPILEKYSLSREAFAALPEKVQESLVDGHVVTDDVDKKVETVRGEFDVYRKDTETIMEDPVIAARIAELSGKGNFVARELAPITQAELKNLDDLLTEDNTAAATDLINKMIRDRAEAAVRVERQISDHAQQTKVLRKEVAGAFKKIGEIDPRLKFEVDNFETLNPQHKKWGEWEKSSLKEFKDYCIKRNWSMQHIVDMGPQELYSAFSAHKGWGKERDAKLVKTGRDALLKALRNPKQAAVSLPGDATRNQGRADGSAGFNRDSLKAELIAGKGNSRTYNRLLEINDGNEAMMMQLMSVYDEAQRAINR